MKKKELVCIVCPNGCPLEIEIENKGKKLKIIEVSGNLCDKGPVWAEQELLNPVRSIASNIRVENGDFPLVSVRTDSPVPFGSIFDVMEEIKKAQVKAPIAIGDCLIDRPAGISCRIIATRNVNEVGARSMEHS